jgi:hypothetical protein
MTESTITRCGGCGLPAHASETDDSGRHPGCAPDKRIVRHRVVVKYAPRPRPARMESPSWDVVNGYADPAPRLLPDVVRHHSEPSESYLAPRRVGAGSVALLVLFLIGFVAAMTGLATLHG